MRYENGRCKRARERLAFPWKLENKRERNKLYRKEEEKKREIDVKIIIIMKKFNNCYTAIAK